VEEFPFTKEEWGRVNAVTTSLTNATLADDDVLSASEFVELVAILDELREIHGEHPTLDETEADFLIYEPAESVRLYRKAIDLAVEHGLPTYTIRISLARKLHEEFGDAATANQELEACRAELTLADDGEQREWHELKQMVSSKQNTSELN
jgi:hypothetical protein